MSRGSGGGRERSEGLIGSMESKKGGVERDLAGEQRGDFCRIYMKEII